MLRIIISILFVFTLMSPSILELCFPNFTTSLGGVTKERKLLPLTMESILSGNFQKKFEKWFLSKLKVRPLLVKTDNQLNVTLFSQLSSSSKGKAILGNDGHFIERIYLKRGQGALAPKKRKLKAKVKELASLHQALSERDITLVILISPNKPSFYPDTVPSLQRISEDAISPYNPLQSFTELLEEEEIPFIASKNVLQSLEDSYSYPFFSHTGTHWSELGSCLIGSQLVDLLTRQIPEFTGKLQCKVDGERKLPLPGDRDLLSMANIWTPEIFIRKAPKVERLVTKGDHKPEVLFVGTSFLWALLYNLDKTELFKERDMYYYFKRLFAHPSQTKEIIDREDQAWIKRALEKEVIVLEANEAFLHRLGYGFPKQVLAYLEETK